MREEGLGTSRVAYLNAALEPAEVLPVVLGQIARAGEQNF